MRKGARAKLWERQIERCTGLGEEPQHTGRGLAWRTTKQYELGRVAALVGGLREEQFTGGRGALINRRYCRDQEISALIVAATETGNRDGRSRGRRDLKYTPKWHRQICEARNLMEEHRNLSVAGKRNCSG